MVTWLLFAAKIEARTDNLLGFVYFSSRCLLPFHHGGWFIVPAQHSPVNVISQAMHEVFDCPFGVRLPPHDSQCWTVVDWKSKSGHALVD